MPIFETDRLILSKLTVYNAEFILALLNEPAFHENIGDKGVHTTEEAISYLKAGPIASYKNHGYGLYLTSLKQSKSPIGICGIKKRDSMDFPELGYAFLKKYWGCGYATEASHAILEYAKHKLDISKIVALTAPDNRGSIRVLEKTGFKFQTLIELPEFDTKNKLYILHL